MGAPAPVTRLGPSRTGRGVTPSGAASAVPRSLSISTASICASSQVIGEVGPASASSARSAARRPVSGSGSVRRRRPAAASTSRTNSRWVSVSGPASS